MQVLRSVQEVLQGTWLGKWRAGAPQRGSQKRVIDLAREPCAKHSQAGVFRMQMLRSVREVLQGSGRERLAAGAHKKGRPGTKTNFVPGIQNIGLGARFFPDGPRSAGGGPKVHLRTNGRVLSPGAAGLLPACYHASCG